MLWYLLRNYHINDWRNNLTTPLKINTVTCLMAPWMVHPPLKFAVLSCDKWRVNKTNTLCWWSYFGNFSSLIYDVWVLWGDMFFIICNDCNSITFLTPFPHFRNYAIFSLSAVFIFWKIPLGIPPILITHLHISKSRNQRTVTLNPKIKIDIAKVPQSPPITNRVIREVLNKKKEKVWNFTIGIFCTLCK